MNPVHLDPQQRRISERLDRLVGPGTAAFFRDACRLMIEPSRFESTTHQVSHLLREIESALRNVLGIVADRRKPAVTNPSAKSIVRSILGRIDNSLHRALAFLGEEREPRQESRRLSHGAEIREILSALEVPLESVVAKAWLRHVKKGGLHGRAHRRHLLAPRPVDTDFRRFWEDMQDILDAALERFEKRFVKVQETIEALLVKERPAPADVTILRERIPNNLVGQGRFLEKLEHAGWLVPLNNAGFFSEPPVADHDEAGLKLSFPPWPAGRYLARMANVADVRPIVLEIALTVPDTDNLSVHLALADVALALDPAFATRLVSKARGWLSHDRHDGFLCHKLADLVISLATGGEVSAALQLASEIFAVLPSEDGKRIAPGHARGRIGNYQYRPLLDKCRKALRTKTGSETIELCSGLLDTAILLTRDTGEDDHSPIWRPSIESDTQDGPDSVQDALVSAIRDCAREIVEEDPAAVTAIIRMLERKRHPIYRRLALDVLAQSPERHLALVEGRLLETSRWDSSERYEFATLARRAFPHLSDPARGVFLSWIDAGPNTVAWAASWTTADGSPPASEEVESYRRSWQRDRLAPLKDVLPTDWRARYDSLVALEGEPDHPDFPLHVRTWSGPTSPLDTAHLATMTIDQVLEYLRTWKAESDWMSPTPEGLGRHLAAFVATDPARFAASAVSFVDLDPTYIRTVLGGIRDGLKAGRAFDWNPVLTLANWVVGQPRSPGDGDRPDRGRDPHWGWARKTIADLLHAGFGSQICPIPFSLRERIWLILSALAEDPDPRPEDEAKYGGSNADPAHMSINTTRGESMHAVIGYALWVRQNGPSTSPSAFVDMPEVRAVFEKHLNPSYDPSTTVRAVYGWRLRSLCYLDRAWVEEKLGDLFPARDESLELRDAVWETYIGFNAPGADTWPLLEGEYHRAVESLKEGRARPARKSVAGDPMAQHVMTLYWHGQQGLGEDSLVTRFFEVASADLRYEALSFIGRNLQGTKEEIPEEVIVRVKALWQKRLEAGVANPEDHAKELSAFAWWVKVDRFDLDWRLAQLAKVLRTVGPVAPTFVVVETLSEAAETHPGPAVECLAAIVETRSNRAESSMWSAEARTLLSRALASSDVAAARAARDLVNVLEARGYPGYRELLAESAA